jgi:hypothetical protein
MWVGLSAASAFGVAALMSTATAPTARADDFSDIVADVQALISNAQGDFAIAGADFAGGISQFPDGLAESFDAIDDLLLAPDQVFVGSVDALTGVPVTEFGPDSTLPVETTLTGALSDAQTIATEVTQALENLPTALSTGDFNQAAIDLIAPSFYDDVAGQLVFMGAIDQLLGV